MKKLMILSAILMVFGVTTACADNDKPITVAQLPAKAQQFVKAHFSNEKVALAKLEQDFLETTYEVVFTNGSKVEFLKNGEWKEIDCKYSTVPVAVVPAQITQYISQNYPDTKVVKLERDRREYEVKITNGLELTFDTRFNLIDIDD